MGQVIHFPSGEVRDDDSSWPTDATPVSILEEFLEAAKQDQFVFLAVAAYRVDGTYTHVELGLAIPEEAPPPEPA